MKKKTSTSLLLGVLAASLVATPCYGSATQKKISAAQNTQQENQKQLDNTQGRISSLESKKNDLEGYLKELNQQLSELGENLQEIQTQSEEKQTELEKLEKELVKAQEKEDEQYESMKLRIQYMYENSDNSYMMLLLEADSFTDFLSQAENMTEMTKYDRKMLEEYKKTTEEIKEKENSIKKEQKKLENLKQESLEKQDEVAVVVKSTRGQIETYESQISAEQSSAKALLGKIEQQKNNIDHLIKLQKDEEAAQILAQQKEEASGPSQDNSGVVQQPVQPSAPEAEDNSQNSQPEEAPAPQEQPENNQSESQNNSNGNYLGRFTMTGYCNCEKCGGHESGLTASGTTPVPGRTVAMGGVPFGTKLLINGNVYTVEDRGVPYGHVDIFFNSHEEALQFGRGTADVYQVN